MQWLSAITMHAQNIIKIMPLQVDMAYIPFVERANIFLSQVWKYEITKGRPKLASWIKVSRRYVEVKRPYFS